MNRLDDLVRLYGLLDRLESTLGGARTLDHRGTPRDWPGRGVYFFFEPGEHRSDSGTGLRLVRVGTHALGESAKSTLHQRLRQHGGKSAEEVTTAALSSGSSSARRSWCVVTCRPVPLGA